LNEGLRDTLLIAAVGGVVGVIASATAVWDSRRREKAAKEAVTQKNTSPSVFEPWDAKTYRTAGLFLVFLPVWSFGFLLDRYSKHRLFEIETPFDWAVWTAICVVAGIMGGVEAGEMWRKRDERIHKAAQRAAEERPGNE